MAVVILTQYVVDGLNRIGIGEFTIHETPERMAWIVEILARIEYKSEWFPGGKWATLHTIRHQVEYAAKEVVVTLGNGKK